MTPHGKLTSPETEVFDWKFLRAVRVVAIAAM